MTIQLQQLFALNRLHALFIAKGIQIEKNKNKTSPLFLYLYASWPDCGAELTFQSAKMRLFFLTGVKSELL